MRIIRLPEVIERTALSRSTIYNMMQTGAFPKSIPIGARAVGWLEEDIEVWITNAVMMSKS